MCALSMHTALRRWPTIGKLAMWFANSRRLPLAVRHNVPAEMYRGAFGTAASACSSCRLSGLL